MAVHGFVEHKRGAFRARLIHFQRLKIVPDGAWKGPSHRLSKGGHFSLGGRLGVRGVWNRSDRNKENTGFELAPALRTSSSRRKTVATSISFFTRTCLDGYPAKTSVRHLTSRARRIASRLRSFPTSLNSIRQAKTDHARDYPRSVPGSIRNDQPEPSAPAGRSEPHALFPGSRMRLFDTRSRDHERPSHQTARFKERSPRRRPKCAVEHPSLTTAPPID